MTGGGGIDSQLPVCEGLDWSLRQAVLLLELTRVRQEVCGEGLEGLDGVGFGFGGGTGPARQRQW